MTEVTGIVEELDKDTRKECEYSVWLRYDHLTDSYFVRQEFEREYNIYKSYVESDERYGTKVPIAEVMESRSSENKKKALEHYLYFRGKAKHKYMSKSQVKDFEYWYNEHGSMFWDWDYSK